MRQRIANVGVTLRPGTINRRAKSQRRARADAGRAVFLLEPMEQRRLLSADVLTYHAEAYAYEPIDLVPPAEGGSSDVVSLERLTSTDDRFETLDLLGNTFTFYGVTYSSLHVSTNGVIAFGELQSSASGNNDNLALAMPEAAIAPLWDDWATWFNHIGRDDQVLRKFDGNRLIIEWNKVENASGDTVGPDAAVTFQAILQLNTGTRPGEITFNYVDLHTADRFGDGGSATVGIKNAGTSNPLRLLISQDGSGGVLEPNVTSMSAIRLFANRAPVLDALVGLDVAEGGSLSLTASALDPENDELVYEWDLDGDGTYEPTGRTATFSAAGIDGPDSRTIRVRVSDGLGGWVTTSGTVNIRNVVPVALADTASTTEDAPVVIDVLSNDSDAGGDALSPVIRTGPAHGTVTINPDGTITYAPTANYFGGDSFTYVAWDGDDESEPTTVELQIAGVADAPAAQDDVYAAVEDTPLSVAAGGLLANDSDADGDALTVQLVLGPERGLLTLNADGTFEYTPPANFSGAMTFTYAVSDGVATSAPATVTLNFDEVNDAPVAGNDRGTTTDLEPITGNVLVNDSDVDDLQLTATLVEPTSLVGTLAFNPDGSFTYTPVQGFSGTETFNYIVSDGRGGSGVGTVNIVVTAEEPPEGTIQLVDDPTLPGRTMLVVNGTDGSEVLAVVHHWNGVEVYFGFESRGVYQPTGRVVVRGNGGDDVLLVGPAVQLPAWLYGDGGNDVVKLGHGGGIAFGGAGNDLVSGGNGRDLLVGGEGADALFGLAGDDVLIAGYTTYDNRAANADHEAAWSHLHAEWVSSRTFEQRVASLGGGGGGSNGSYFLNEATVEDDAAPGAADILTGSGGHDWFIYTFGEDRVTALTVTEAPYDLGVA